jgi:D-alanyl-lipoteichoic acid acyltransferase DltB (MBOAT superfamily)
MLTSSVAFYAAFSPGGLAILLTIIALSWIGGEAVARDPRPLTIVVAIGALLMPLVVVKYVPWLLASAAGAPWWRSSESGTRGLPPGISFITLQAIGYVVDVRRRIVSPTARLAEHSLFLAFFPQLVAGPIERVAELRPQLAAPQKVGYAELYAAAKLALWGYALKLLFADPLALAIDSLTASATAVTPAAVLLALALFSMRLYFDFYGYSCIAVALGQAHGIRLTMNFRHPYGAIGFIDFWRRWHISLSTWWRDYVYRPLGGSISGWRSTVVSTVAVFALSGLWHGAGAGFLLWGILHGIVLLVERGLRGVTQRQHSPNAALSEAPLASLGAQMLTWSVVTVLWIPFLANERIELPFLIARLASAFTFPFATLSGLAEFAPIYAWAIVLAFFGVSLDWAISRWYLVPSRSGGVQRAFEVCVTNVLVVGLILFGDLGARSFIYFAF